MSTGEINSNGVCSHILRSKEGIYSACAAIAQNDDALRHSAKVMGKIKGEGQEVKENVKDYKVRQLTKRCEGD